MSLYYESILLSIVITIVLIGLIRLLTQAWFLKRHLKQPFIKGMIPFVSNILFYKKIRSSKLNCIGMILRIVGFILMIVTLLWQYYYTLIQLTHMYGLIFHTYVPKDFSLVWDIMSWGGIALILAGIACRLIVIKKTTQLFSMNKKLIQFFGMIEPTFCYAVLATSRNALYIMNKPTKQMSQEEYELYCLLFEE